jgi:hypothetical protein
VSDKFGGFELKGVVGDETRLLVHEAGFAAAIPGHPAASAGRSIAPVSHIRITLADKPVEITYRMDNVTTQLLMEPFAVALTTAYAENRAKERAHVRVSRGAELINGAEAGARAIYTLAGNDPSAMEWISVILQSVGAREVFALYQSVRFRREDLNAVQFANLRTAMVGAQEWGEQPATNLTVWRESRFAKPSVALELTDDAWAEAQAKAGEIGAVDADDIATLTDLLIGFANNEHLPSSEVPKAVLDVIAQRVASNAPTHVSLVLLRNLFDVRTMHDLRGWCWQQLWALGNRAELHAS